MGLFTVSTGALLWALSSVYAQTTAPETHVLPLRFDQDTPCLDNQGTTHETGDTDFSHQGGILGLLASEGGACHGLSRWVAVSAQNLRYDCTSTERMSFASYARMLRRAHFLWERGCRNRLTVTGFCNLRETCQSRVDESRQLVVGLQTTGTANQGLATFLDTLTNLDDEDKYRESYSALRYAMNEIDRGRYPILYRFAHLDSRYGHMLVLHGYEKRRGPALGSFPASENVTLHLYDPSNPRTPFRQNAILYPDRGTAISRDSADILNDFQVPWRRGAPLRVSECNRLVQNWEREDARSRDWSPPF